MAMCVFLVRVMLTASMWFKMAISIAIFAATRMEFNMKTIIKSLICVVVGTALLGRSGGMFQSYKGIHGFIGFFPLTYGSERRGVRFPPAPPDRF